MSGSRERSDARQPSTRRPTSAVGGLAVVGVLAVLLIVPLVVRGQAGPMRDQGPPDTPAATATAGAFPTDPLLLGGDESSDRNPPISAPVPRRPSDATSGNRPRPDAAPIVLMPTAVVTPTPEPLARTRARSRPVRRPALSRIWPVAPGTFELSQRFGCVPQLLGYYPMVPGCPANASSFHNGLDFAATQGTPIYAAASGWVTVAGRDRDDDLSNTRLVIQHDGGNEGYATEYYHWIRAYVEPGDYVRAGDLIAEVGSVGYSTGPHLHFTVVDAATSQAIDPTRWLPATTSSTSLAEATLEQDRVFSGGGSIVVRDYIPPTPTPTPPRR